MRLDALSDCCRRASLASVLVVGVGVVEVAVLVVVVCVGLVKEEEAAGMFDS
jgi:hypothetical protein